MKFSLYTVKQTTASLAWLLIGMLVLAPMGRHATGVVLCIEGDGRINVERTNGIACTTFLKTASHSKESHDVLESSGADDPEHCEKCIDIVIPTGGDEDCVTYKGTSGPSLLTDLPFTATLSSDLFVLPVLARHTWVQKAGNLSLSDPTPLRSVVLLI